MRNYLQIFQDAYIGYYNFLVSEITLTYTYKPLWQNYFYLLILISLLVFGLELLSPWRKEQPKFRKDFWLDLFYMFFNFFLFSLIIFNAASQVVVNLFGRRNGFCRTFPLSLDGNCRLQNPRILTFSIDWN